VAKQPNVTYFRKCLRFTTLYAPVILNVARQEISQPTKVIGAE
jgi:hypothetical protein